MIDIKISTKSRIFLESGIQAIRDVLLRKIACQDAENPFFLGFNLNYLFISTNPF